MGWTLDESWLEAFPEEYGAGIAEEIDFNTTDAFQGRECEIIIFSCVRASPTGGIGFMTDCAEEKVGGGCPERVR